MTSVEISYSERYQDELIEIPSSKIVEHIFELEDRLAVFPGMGSPLVRDSLVARYGRDVRKLVVGSYVLLYRREGDRIEMLACVPASTVT